MYWMNRSRIALLILFVAIVASAAPRVVQAQSDGPPVIAYLEGDDTTIDEYWTVERMRAAQPIPMPHAVYDPNTQDQQEIRVMAPDSVPGYAPGWAPGGGAQPSADAAFEIGVGDPLWSMASGSTGNVAPRHGSPPSSPSSGPYPPFQRWTWYGNYLAYPTSTVGKLFFTLNGSNYVCSASVIQKNTIALAAHCVSDGNGSLLSSATFCPSYCGAACGFGPHPARGCWSAVLASLPGSYHNGGATDRDFACLVLSTSGNTVADNVGDVTGWTGRAWNWSSSQPIFAAGYPAASPFAGYHLITAFSAEWYTVDMTLGDGQVSKYIGNDMTGGSSGGPWWLNIGHRTAEYGDTDGSSITDPGQNGSSPLINGVNSHSRCSQAGCPAGSIFTQEMGSPQFTGTSGASGESEDIFQICFNNGGV